MPPIQVAYIILGKGVIVGKELKGLGCIPSPKDVRDYKIQVATAQEFPEEFELKTVAVKNYGQVGSCHDEQTQVLTKFGWKYFKDITYDDMLASVCKETGEIIFENPVDIIKPYSSPLLRIIAKVINFFYNLFQKKIN